MQGTKRPPCKAKMGALVIHVGDEEEVLAFG